MNWRIWGIRDAKYVLKLQRHSATRHYPRFCAVTTRPGITRTLGKKFKIWSPLEPDGGFTKVDTTMDSREARGYISLVSFQ